MQWLFSVLSYQNHRTMRTILVTGATGNLGQAVSRKFLEEGCRVIGSVNLNDAAASLLEHENFEAAALDLKNEEAAKKLVEDAVKKYETIDAAVLTVGGFDMGTMAETKGEAVRQMLQLNFQTAYHVARPVFTQMLLQGYGRIFLIGARAGIDMRNSKGMIAYGLSKSLIFRLAELMNEEAAGSNVVTAVVVPSIIDTPQNRQAMPDADFDKWVNPSAIADLLFYHSSAEASVLRETIIKAYGRS